jgi:molybdenum cofactor cytidylyltransferase
VAAVVLAAGRSRRFGAANKLLTPYLGQPLLWWSLDAVAASGVRPIHVVVGHQRALIALSLRLYRVHKRRAPALRIVANRRYRLGLSTSLQAGLRSLPDTVRAAVVILGDMPAVSPRLIRQLCNAYEDGDSAVVPMQQDQQVNPVVIARPLFGAINTLAGDEGARRVLKRAAGVRRLPLADTTSRLRFDIDRRRDLAVGSRSRRR